jgi:radical SAM superfamily enzyme YgiQ (UPF0313 family)
MKEIYWSGERVLHDQDIWEKRRDRELFGHLPFEAELDAIDTLHFLERKTKINLLRELPAKIEVDHGLPTFDKASNLWRKRKNRNNDFRVLVVTPPDEEGNIASTNKGIYPPLALWRIASYAKEHGATADFIDGTIATEEEISQKIREFNPDLIGFSVLTSSVNPAIRLSKIAKEINGIVVWGNDYPSQNTIETICKRDYVDVVIRGDGADRSFGEMINVNKGPQLGWFVPGASWREADGIISRLIDTYDLDEAIIPDPKLFPKDKFQTYTRNFQERHAERFGNVGVVLLDAMRGCHHGEIRCTYCDIPDLRIQKKSAAHIRKELEMILENYIDHDQKLLVYCTGDNLTSLAMPYAQVYEEAFGIKGASDRIWLDEVISETAHLRDRVSWFVYTRADDLVRFGIANRLKKFGVVALNIGIDHFDDEMLSKGIHKGNHLTHLNPSEVNRRALLIAKEKGFAVHASFVLGAPGETKESLRNFIEGYKWMLDKLGSKKIMSIEVGALIPFKGSRAYEMACRKSPKFDAKYKDADTANLEEMTRDAMEILAPAIDFDQDIIPVITWAKQEAKIRGIITGGAGLKE